MFQKSKLYSILNNKCPKCHKGDFFIDNHVYNLKTFVTMHSRCEYCNESLEKEIGFYYGAMYISYGLNIGYGIALFLLMVLILNLALLVYLFSFLVLVLALFPWTMRISRLVYINLFVSYDDSIK